MCKEKTKMHVQRDFLSKHQRYCFRLEEYVCGHVQLVPLSQWTTLSARCTMIVSQSVPAVMHLLCSRRQRLPAARRRVGCVGRAVNLRGSCNAVYQIRPHATGLLEFVTKRMITGG